MATSLAPAVLSGLVDLLQAREGLANIQVTSGPMPGGVTKIEFHEIQETQRFAGFGKTQGRPTRAGTFTFTGLVEANLPGAGETKIRAVRNQAYELLAELETCLRENIHVGNALWSEFSRGDCRQGSGDSFRWAQIRFEITGESRI